MADDKIIDLAEHRSRSAPDDEPPTIIHGAGGDIADLVERRAEIAKRKKRGGDPNDRTRIRADREGKVELRIGYVGGCTETLVCEPETAENFARLLRNAARVARAIASDNVCEDCGKAWCNAWHVGQRVQGWARGREVVAYVAKLTRRSVRLEPVDGTAAFYRSLGGRYNWRLVGRGRLVPVGPGRD